MECWRALWAVMVTVVLLGAAQPLGKEHVNSMGMRLARVEAGSFRMGEGNELSDELIVPLTYPTRDELVRRFPWGDAKKFVLPLEGFRRGDWDERPVHGVRISRAFYIGVHEVTNAQYEQFDPGHRALRGKRGYSKADDEAVVWVSWEEAHAFCAWLSRKEGLPYRLPTEAEWEHAARAGTTTPFWTGETLPAAFLKNARSTDFRGPEDVVSLAVGRTPANAWGLHDVHGNVEEWTEDWYGPYEAGEQVDPVGRVTGDFKVTRGGSHGTVPYYLRSANRMGTLPETRNWLIGFRVVLGEMAATKPLPAVGRARHQEGVRQGPLVRVKAPDANKPFFKGPRRFVKLAAETHGPVYSHHNHDTAVAECPNGDLLAIWYTCEQERGRELAVAASRLRHGAEEWEPADVFWDAPDRNDHCPALWFDGKGTLYHFNGLGAAGRWEPLAIVMRTSKDSGATWSRARLIAPEYGYRNMVGWPVLRTRSGALLFGADAGGGSTIWVSQDEGETWRDAGGRIRGIHAAIAELSDGRLMALGRGESIEGWMPASYSADLGKTWSSSASVFPPIGGGQRAVLLRLREGPLFFASFAEDVGRLAPMQESNARRHVSSLFGALSFDEGKTWPVRRVITDGQAEHGVATIDGGQVRMSGATSEPQGYLAACQARDGVIHLISSVNHYAFNAAWLKQGQPAASRRPRAQRLPARRLARVVAKAQAVGEGRWSNERSGEFEGLDAAKGFTVEARAAGDFELEVYARGSALITNHYRIAVVGSGVSYWYDGAPRKVAEGPGNSGAYHEWRLAVRPDTAVQIYRDGTLLGVEPADLVIDWRQPARGSYVEWRGEKVGRIAYDLSGAHR